jgi:predicted ABC-type transport system involved in lysophospholipase L1 biosynthesis ATPase subunit
MQALKAVPSLAWVPLFILWFGIFEVSKVVLIAVGVFFPVYLNLVSGIRSTDRKLVEVGQVNGLGRIDMVRRILAPAALPSYITGLRRLGAWLDVRDCSRADGRQQGLGLPDAGRADDWAARDDRVRPAPFCGGRQDLGRAARRGRSACPSLARRFRLGSGQGGPMTLQISGLTKRFNDEAGLGRAALDRIDLEVDEHEAVALVGTSGCGKTTLLRIISGIERATSGRLTLRGDTVTGPRRDVGVVFQEPRLMPWLTARENIRLALLDLAPTEQAAAIGNLLRDLGLSDFADALPRQLSGGMAQRVAIARALARKPQVLSCCSMNHSGPSTISRGSSCSIISALFGRSPASL